VRPCNADFVQGPALFETLAVALAAVTVSVTVRLLGWQLIRLLVVERSVSMLYVLPVTLKSVFPIHNIYIYLSPHA
jgi:hypothetical protein